MKRTLKSLLRGPVGCFLIATYLRLVFFTSRKAYFGNENVPPNVPSGAVIYANWHGQNFLFPFWFRGKPATNALVATHGDGQMIGRAIGILGVKLIHGSGNKKAGKSSKGGARAFLKMLRVLKSGETVSITADVPKVGRVVGDGVLLLARKSGAPIIPVGIATSRRKLLRNWDRTQIHLPFSRLVYVVGPAIRVPDDDSALEIHRTRLQSGLDAAQAAAFGDADRVA